MTRLTRLSPQVQIVDPDTGDGTMQIRTVTGPWLDAIEALEEPIADIPNLAGGATLANVITAVNTLFNELRAKGFMT